MNASTCDGMLADERDATRFGTVRQGRRGTAPRPGACSRPARFNAALIAGASPISSEFGMLTISGSTSSARNWTSFENLLALEARRARAASTRSCAPSCARLDADAPPGRQPQQRRGSRASGSSNRGVRRNEREVLLEKDIDAAEEHAMVADVPPRRSGSACRSGSARTSWPASISGGRQRVVAQAAAAVHVAGAGGDVGDLHAPSSLAEAVEHAVLRSDDEAPPAAAGEADSGAPAVNSQTLPARGQIQLVEHAVVGPDEHAVACHQRRGFDTGARRETSRPTSPVGRFIACTSLSRPPTTIRSGGYRGRRVERKVARRMPIGPADGRRFARSMPSTSLPNVPTYARSPPNRRRRARVGAEGHRVELLSGGRVDGAKRLVAAGDVDHPVVDGGRAVHRAFGLGLPDQRAGRGRREQ